MLVVFALLVAGGLGAANFPVPNNYHASGTFVTEGVLHQPKIKSSFVMTVSGDQQAMVMDQTFVYPRPGHQVDYSLAKTGDCASSFNNTCHVSCRNKRSCGANPHPCGCGFENALAGFALNGTKGGGCGDKGTLFVITESTLTITLCYALDTNTPIFVTLKQGPVLMATITFVTWTLGPQPTITLPTSCTCNAPAQPSAPSPPAKSFLAKVLRM